jgi:hypothetical protein
VTSWTRSGLSKPRDEGTQFLNLDNVESSILVHPILDSAERYGTVGRCVNGYEIRGANYISFCEGSPEGRNVSTR